MVKIEELEELRVLLDTLTVAFNNKEAASKPLTISGSHPITGELVTAELTALSEEEIEKINEDYTKALRLFKEKAAALEE